MLCQHERYLISCHHRNPEYHMPNVSYCSAGTDIENPCYIC